MHKEALQALRAEQDWCRVRPAFTCDLWCSATQREYLTVSAHWIEESWKTVPPQRLCQWLMRRRVVATVQIDGDDEDKVTAAGANGNAFLLASCATSSAITNGFVYCGVVVCVLCM